MLICQVNSKKLRSCTYVYLLCLRSADFNFREQKHNGLIQYFAVKQHLLRIQLDLPLRTYSAVAFVVALISIVLQLLNAVIPSEFH